MLRTLVITCLLILGSLKVSAQCGDSSLVQTTSCPPDWIPVCACDGYTYQNDCVARSKGFNSSNYYYGICDPIDFNFYPNPVIDYINVDAIVKNQGTMNVQLMDRFGRMFYSTAYSGVSEIQFQIYVKGFPAGVYFLVLYCNEGYKVKKVVITDLR